MKIIIATSDRLYCQWQLLVQYNNFKKIGMERDIVWLIGVDKDESLSREMSILRKELGVQIFVYDDQRKSKRYVPSIRPHLFYRLMKHIPSYSNNTLFYVDPDILFYKRPNFGWYEGNDTWYVSDTRSYLGVSYIKSKSEVLFNDMCKIIGIDPQIVIDNDVNAGGAQYVMKNTNAEFWKKVEKDSENLYMHMTATSKKYNPQHPIQAWTADMWAVLWNAWLDGHETKITNSLRFSWATDKNLKNKPYIYHNAGVFEQNYLFNKCRFENKSPFNEDFSYVDSQYESKFYVDEIMDTKNNYKSLLLKLGWLN